MNLICTKVEKHTNFHSGRVEGEGDGMNGDGKMGHFNQREEINRFNRVGRNLLRSVLFLLENLFWTFCLKMKNNETLLLGFDDENKFVVIEMA